MNQELLNLPINEFILESQKEIPAVYGKLMVKKIIGDSDYKIRPTPDSENRGDCHIGYKNYYEVKTSYLNKSNRFSLRNIRPWQNLDCFILCLIDTSNREKYKSYFYCLPKDIILNNPVLVFTGQNNTKESNDKNMEVGLSTTFSVNDHSWLFKKNNLLKGTSYDDLMNYIIEVSGDNSNTYVSNFYSRQKFEPIKKHTRSQIQKIYLKMGHLVIDGNTNKEVMVNLVKHIGPDKLDGIIWRTWLTKSENSDRTEYMGKGYFFNPKFSIRDINKVIRQINKKLNFSFNIIKK